MDFPNMTFPLALTALKAGRIVRRSGWNGKNMFLFMRPGATVPRIIVQSLPEPVRKYYIDKGIEDITFTGYICMKAADDTIVNGWLASQTDLLAEDWEEV